MRDNNASTQNPSDDAITAISIVQQPLASAKQSSQKTSNNYSSLCRLPQQSRNARLAYSFFFVNQKNCFFIPFLSSTIPSCFH